MESQLTSLRESNENQSKRAEDLNNKLKQVIFSSDFLERDVSRFSHASYFNYISPGLLKVL